MDSSPDMLRQARSGCRNCDSFEADLAPGARRSAPISCSAMRCSSGCRTIRRCCGGLLRRCRRAACWPCRCPTTPSEPALALMREVAASGPMGRATRDRQRPRATICRDPADYYDLLGRFVRHLDIWHTAYNHVMAGPRRLSNGSRARRCGRFCRRSMSRMRHGFLADYAARIARAYPPRYDGRVLLRFPRLFIVAMR